MNILRLTKKIFFRLFLSIIVFFPQLLFAESIIDSSASKYKNGSYTIMDMVVLVIKISQLILGVVGSLALLYFVYGGLMFLFSGGNNERVTKGRTIIQNAIIGLLLVFLSYSIIQFVMRNIFGIDGNWNTMKWFK